MEKKAIVFTLLAITILSFFLVSYSVYSITQDRKTINQRIKTLNDFVFSIEEDIPRQIYISGFRIIFLMEKRIIETGNYITDLNLTFQEAFYNGTIYGNPEELMYGVTFSGILDSLNERGKKINAEVSLSNPKIYFIQEDPWNIKVTLTANLSIKDKNNLVSWNKSFITSNYISIENFEDPLYTVNTNSLVVKKINKTVYEPFVQGEDVTNLQKHLENSFYINSNLAPSFLDRLQGKTTPNENGIESLVYLPDLQKQGIDIKTKSIVDYIYFSSDNPISYKINKMPDWFRIDEEHLDIYGVKGLEY